jgi:hypothetical protein
MCLMLKAGSRGTYSRDPRRKSADRGGPFRYSCEKIPHELDQTFQKLEQRIGNFEEAVIGQSTVPTVGVLAADSTKQDNGSIIQTISSAR